MLHIPIVHALDVSKQIPREKKFPSGWKCYKKIGSCVSCAFVYIWSTWEVWRALEKIELLEATPHRSCSPNFPSASYLDERMLTYEPIANWRFYNRFLLSLRISRYGWTQPVGSKRVLSVKFARGATPSNSFDCIGQSCLNKIFNIHKQYLPVQERG